MLQKPSWPLGFVSSRGNTSPSQVSWWLSFLHSSFQFLLSVHFKFLYFLSFQFFSLSFVFYLSNVVSFGETQAEQKRNSLKKKNDLKNLESKLYYFFLKKNNQKVLDRSPYISLKGRPAQIIQSPSNVNRIQIATKVPTFSKFFWDFYHWSNTSLINCITFNKRNNIPSAPCLVYGITYLQLVYSYLYQIIGTS